MPLGVTSMDLEIVILSDNYVRQLRQTKTNTIHCLYPEYKIKVQINLFTEK